MDLPRSRARGRPKGMYMILTNEDMAATTISKSDTWDRRNWKEAIHCGDP